MGLSLVLGLLLETPLPPGITRLNWTCICGHASYDEYDSSTSGVTLLAKRMQDSYAITKATVSFSRPSLVAQISQTLKNAVIDLIRLPTVLRKMTGPKVEVSSEEPNPPPGDTHGFPNDLAMPGSWTKFDEHEMDGDNSPSSKDEDIGSDNPPERDAPPEDAGQEASQERESEDGSDDTRSEAGPPEEPTIVPKFLHLCLHQVPGIPALKHIELVPSSPSREISSNQELFRELKRIHQQERRMRSGIRLQGIYFVRVTIPRIQRSYN
jgi:hypothetical protein